MAIGEYQIQEPKKYKDLNTIVGYHVEKKVYPNVAEFLRRYEAEFEAGFLLRPIFPPRLIIRRKFSISIGQVTEIANKDWNEIKRILEDELKKRGFLRADAIADALIEEAKAWASAIVREQLGEDVPELAEKIAKYIIAFALAEKPVEEEEEATYIPITQR